jgi:hypothetical protein
MDAPESQDRQKPGSFWQKSLNANFMILNTKAFSIPEKAFFIEIWHLLDATNLKLLILIFEITNFKLC